MTSEQRPDELLSGMIRKGISSFHTLVGGLTDALRAGDSTIKEMDSALTGQASLAPTTPEQSFLEILALLQAAIVEAREAGSASVPTVVQRAREILGRVSREEPSWRPAPSTIRTVNDVFRTALRDLRASQDLVKLATGKGSLDDLDKLTQWGDDLTDRLAKTQKIVSQPKPSTKQRAPAASAPNPKAIDDELSHTSSGQPSQTQDIATACVPCALGHFSTSSGLLNECVRFKEDGIASNEILDRVAKVLAEQNALERVDLTPEMIAQSPEWEREMAERALKQSRSLRHKLENLQSMADIEQAAAETAAFYRKLNREWFQKRLTRRGGVPEVPAENSSEEST